MKTAYYNGIVYTGEGFAQAFITEGGLFGAVGSNEEILSQMVDEKIDLQGHFVCAGFNDSHMHLLRPLSENISFLAIEKKFETKRYVQHWN